MKLLEKIENSTNPATPNFGGTFHLCCLEAYSKASRKILVMDLYSIGCQWLQKRVWRYCMLTLWGFRIS